MRVASNAGEPPIVHQGYKPQLTKQEELEIELDDLKKQEDKWENLARKANPANKEGAVNHLEQIRQEMKSISDKIHQQSSLPNHAESN